MWRSGLKFVTALWLLPATVALTRALLDLLRELSGGTWRGWSWSAWGLLIGFVLWILAYAIMPRPFRTYVLAHELTHALWGWAMGAKIKGMKVSRSGGYVRLTKSNFLITLAPYFFPFYTVLVILLHAIASWFIDLQPYEPVWMGWIGMTWGFHLTFTLSMLHARQPDIREEGRFFSYTIIYIFNLLGVGCWIILVSARPWTVWSRHLGHELVRHYGAVIDTIAGWL